MLGFVGGLCHLLFFKGVVCRCMSFMSMLFVSFMSMFVDVCRVTSVVSYVAYVVLSFRCLSLCHLRRLYHLFFMSLCYMSLCHCLYLSSCYYMF